MGIIAQVSRLQSLDYLCLLPFPSFVNTTMTGQDGWLLKWVGSGNRRVICKTADATYCPVFVLTAKKVLLGVVLLGMAIGWLPGVNAWSLEIDSTLDEEIRFQPQPQVKRFAKRLKPLWIEALKRPEIELKRQAALAIVRAHRDGMHDLQDAIEVLTEILRDESLHPTIELAVVQALIELDVQEAAPHLFDCVHTTKLELTGLIEPAMARWDYKPIRAIWHKRLAQQQTPRPLLVLAIDGLATVGDLTAVDALKNVALDERTPPDLRLKAARATGRLQQEGLEEDVQSLIDDTTSVPIIDRLVAVLLLRHHEGSDAQQRLLALAVDPEGAVGALALERLREIDPSLVKNINDELVASSDTNVSRVAAQCLMGQATVDAVALLGVLLDDPIPDIRLFAGDALAHLFDVQELRDPIRSAAVQMLSSDRPRGLEQAALVVGQIDHEPAADRLVELLTHSEPKVSTTAAWALRRLVVPKTGAPIFDYVRRQTLETRKLDDELWTTWNQDPPPEVNFVELKTIYGVIEHLLQALAALKYKEAEPILPRFLPAPKIRNLGDPPPVAVEFQLRTRATAVGTLGHLYEGEPDNEFKDEFLAILSQRRPLGDPSEIRAAAAAALARMKAMDVIPVLQSNRGELPPHDMVGAACCRALQKLAGEPFPPAIPKEFHLLNWFLEPLPEND